MQKQALETLIPYQCSKWLYLDLLVDPVEFQDLIETLGDVEFFPNGMVLEGEPFEFSHEKMGKLYGEYVDSLKTEKGFSFPPFALTKEKEAIYPLKLKGKGYLIKPRAPVIQMVEHRFIVTSDGRLQSMVFGSDTVRWGIRFAFPQLFIDPHSRKVIQVLKEWEGENIACFRALQKWVRDKTRPTALSVYGEKKMAPFRIGLVAREWIAEHADLRKKELVYTHGA